MYIVSPKAMALYDSNVCGCSSVGRTDVFQTSGHEFEPRYPLIVIAILVLI